MTVLTTSLMTVLVVASAVTLAASALMLALVVSRPLIQASAAAMTVASVVEAFLLMPTIRWLLGRLLWFVYVLFCHPKVLES
jgi:hypothetical protein